MGAHQFPAKMLGRIPTYYVTDVFMEDAGGGNVRILNCERKSGNLVPLFEVILPAAALLPMGRNISDFAQAIFNETQLRLDGMKVH